jgi:prepilin-type N-terminal cleavage/methylation domain-containing protein
MKKKPTFQPGFTLIELLVVISIIGILAALLLANFVGVRGRAGDAKRKAELRELKTALRLYYNDYQNYPDMTNGTDIAGCGINGTSNCGGVGAEFSAGSGPSLYIKQLPEDFFYYSDGVNEFLLRTPLENASDESIADSQARCDPDSRSYYSGTPTELDFFMCED